MTTVINIKRVKMRTTNMIYIGRGSKWGNPYIMQDHSLEERDRVCNLYEKYINEKIISGELNIKELKDKILMCYCKPLRCHGDYLAELANRY